MTKHIRKWKEESYVEIKQLVDKYPVVAIASLEGFPANLFSELRKKLANKAVVKVSKTRVVQKALQESNISNKDLAKKANKSIAIIFTEMNPFELYAYLKKNKGSANAKPGMEAPNDILVTAGDTGLPPGPALSTLKAAGLKTKLQGPTIEIAEDKVVTKKGEIVRPEVASVLQQLNIKPIKVGLNIIAACEDGELYKANVLNIDNEEVFNNFVIAQQKAFNLAFNATIFTNQTTELFIQKAFRESKALALEANIYSTATIPDILAKATRQAKAIKGFVKEETKVKEESNSDNEEKKE